MEALEAKLTELAEERERIETDMNSGSLDHTALAKAGARIQAIIAETDEAEMRLLELMEKEG